MRGVVDKRPARCSVRVVPDPPRPHAHAPHHRRSPYMARVSGTGRPRCVTSVHGGPGPGPRERRDRAEPPGGRPGRARLLPGSYTEPGTAGEPSDAGPGTGWETI